MKGRESKGPPAADLLVCFPPRAHLTLLPKPICSPARSSDPSTSHHRPHRRLRHTSHLRRSSKGGSCGHASPLLWAKPNKTNNSDISEPTSPKVTCAGQIKVRPKPDPCESWQSVMEEIERLHDKKKAKKSGAWMDALGFKKDVAQFLTCLRNLRLDFRCFGSFPAAGISSSDEDEDEDEDDENYAGEEENRDESSSKAIFSKWFMILPENKGSNNNNNDNNNNNNQKGKTVRPCMDDAAEGVGSAPVPPPNALLLMRCRSAPAKSWVEEGFEEIDENEEEKEELVVLRCGTQFSAEIAKETWVVGGGGIKDTLSRSRSSGR